jgi:hypothetical protein
MTEPRTDQEESPTMTVTETATEAREFIIAGRDEGTGFTLWDIAPAPTDPVRRATALEELEVDAMDAFGTITTEWAATPRQAVNKLLAEFRDRTGLDDYDLTADSQTDCLGPLEPMPETAGNVLCRALKAAGIDTIIEGDGSGSWAVVDLPCGAEIWITNKRGGRVGCLAGEHQGWTATFCPAGADSAVKAELLSAHSGDLDADTRATVNAVVASVHADHHATPLRLAPHTLADIAAAVRPHLPDAAALTLDVSDGTLRAVLDHDRRTLWYAPASPLGLPDAVTGQIERLADLLLHPGRTNRGCPDTHDDTCEITLPRP